jgi:hypothetical protein
LLTGGGRMWPIDKDSFICACRDLKNKITKSL